MRRLSLLFVVCVCSGTLLSQNITNTLGISGSFIVKDGSNTFLTLDQTTGYLFLDRCLTLPYTTASTFGVIYKGTNRFLHNFGTDNTFMGIDAGNFTLTGIDNTAMGVGTLRTNTTGSENTAVGINALSLNTTGSYNTAVGSVSLTKNTIGTANTACGIGSMYSNISGGNNSAFGNVSLYNNIDGFYNSAFGTYSLHFNTAGSENSAVGYQSLYHNTTGRYNTALGYGSLYSQSTGWGNTACGNEALKYTTTGYYNTAIGTFAGGNITTGTGNVAIGKDAQVPNNQGDGQVRIGGNYVVYAGVQVAWSITSDRRWKEHITPSNLGLGFITKLNPVLYIRKNDTNRKTEYGLIAQELEGILKEAGVENAAMLTRDGEGRYELRYNDLLAPMIKAIQELKSENNQLKKELDTLKELQVRLTKVEQKLNNSNVKFTKNVIE